MDKVSDKNKSPAERSAAANPAKDGPHRRVVTDKKTADEAGAPAYVVAVTKHEDSGGGDSKAEAHKNKYDPKELRAKARTLLKSPQISPEHKSVLREILGPEEEKE
jgi:hypothetical protein